MISESEVRSEIRSGLPRTNGRTYGRTEKVGHLPGDTSRLVTRGRAYGFEVWS